MGACLSECVKLFSKTKICCIGDLILDRYLYGTVDRISPEAPVPILSLKTERQVLGGAANVAANLAALGCQVTMCGILGMQEADETLLELLSVSGIKPCMERHADYHLPVKTRMIAGNNQLLRLDHERRMAPNGQLEELCKKRWMVAMAESDLILLSDYAKGGLTDGLIQWAIRWARQHNRKILIDPKGNDYRKYQGASLIKPNLKEFNLAAGSALQADQADFFDRLLQEARKMVSDLMLDGLLVTLSEHGMAYLGADDLLQLTKCATQAKAVFDVSGAGDTVLATLGACLATRSKSGVGGDNGRPISFAGAMQIANIASGLVVEKLGTATVTQAELLARLAQIERSHNRAYGLGSLVDLGQAVWRDHAGKFDDSFSDPSKAGDCSGPGKSSNSGCSNKSGDLFSSFRDTGGSNGINDSDGSCNFGSPSNFGNLGDINTTATQNKIVAREQLIEVVTQLRLQDPDCLIGFTNGCFDCLHPGHLYSLQESKKLCDYLVVAINSDASVRRLKGDTRPLQDQTTRSVLLAALSCVDLVVIFEEDTALPLLQLLRPDVIAKQGYQVGCNWPEADYVLSYGGRAVKLEKFGDYSTSEWWKKVAKTAAQ